MVQIAYRKKQCASGKTRERSDNVCACLGKAFLLPEERVKASSAGWRANGNSPVAAGRGSPRALKALLRPWAVLRWGEGVRNRAEASRPRLGQRTGFCCPISDRDQMEEWVPEQLSSASQSASGMQQPAACEKPVGGF